MSDTGKKINKISKGESKETEDVVEILRERLQGYVIPEFDRGAKSDPDFFAWLTQSSKFCLRDGRALPAKYRLMIHMCLLARVGHLRGIPHYIKTAIEEHGASKLEIIEAFETAMLAGGIPTMIRGIGGLLSYEESNKQKA